MTLRICPKRDAICPHGMDCQFVIDRFNCKDEQDSPVTPAPVGEVTRGQMANAIWKRIGDDPELARTRKVLSIHELRTIIRHALEVIS
jgi:hypothetical protein